MEYLLGKPGYFFEFIDSIKEEDKVGIVSHRDLDGLASAVFAELILGFKGMKVEKKVFVSTRSDVLDNSHGEFRKLGITKVILTDLSVDSFDSEGFVKLQNKYDCFMIDHHPIIEGNWNKKNVIKTGSDDCVALVMYDLARHYFNVSSWDWLVCSAIISDWSFRSEENLNLLIEKSEDIFSRESIDKSKYKKISDMIGSALVYYQSDCPKVYDFVMKKDFKSLRKAYEIIEAALESDINKYRKEAKYYEDKNLYFGHIDLEYDYLSILSTIISKKNPNSTFVVLADSFGSNNSIGVSFRDQSGKVDVNKMARKAVEGIEGAGAGGHLRAAGASFKKEDIEKFKENLLK